MKTFIAAIFLCLLETSANAALTGNDLKEACLNYPRNIKALECITYIGGVSDTWLAAEAFKIKPVFCLPLSATNDQFVLVVNKFLQDNPAKLHLLASALVTIAFKEAFPCKEGEQ